MSYKYYPLTGIKAGWGTKGEVPLRQEFSAWSSDGKNMQQVILFILALRRFQDIPPAARDSYFQIAGIHGMPYKSWDEPNTTVAEVGKKGYCTHANYLFPPWHRLYIVLYEQRIYEIMVQEVIPEYPKDQQASLRALADSWRLPYWDWATNPKIPSLANSAKLNISMPAGHKAIINNPLYKFKMPNDKNMASEGVGDIDFEGKIMLAYGNCFATSRCPKKSENETNSRPWMDGTVNNELVAEAMSEHSYYDKKDHGVAAELVYRLMTYPLDYPEFATVAIGTAPPKVQTDINMEFIHNNIHGWVGGNGGHMAQIPVATFDPIFWLHHCNIDRLWEIWQALNPDKWFTEGGQAEFDQKVIGHFGKVTNKTPLRPFHKDEQGNIWTPDEVRGDCGKFGYSYPEVQHWLPQYQSGGTLNREKYITSILETVNLTYATSRREALHRLEMAEAGTPLPGGMKGADGKVSSKDYAVSIRYSKFAFGGYPFNIQIFLEAADGTRTFEVEQYVANAYNFSSPAVINGVEVCTNCTNLEGGNVKVSAYAPITSFLHRMIEKQRLASLEEENVNKLLKGLYWRITSLLGQPIPEEKWKESMNLQILVSKTNVTHSKDPTVKPVFEDFNVIPSLGVGVTQSDLNTPENNVLYATINQITRLNTEVSIGGSVVLESASLNLNVPSSVDSTGISFMYLDPSGGADPYDEENYDVLLSFSIRRRNRQIRLNSKPAHHGWNSPPINVPLSNWFQRPNPRIRVDIRDSDYEVFIDGRNFRTWQKTLGNKNITHIQYWWIPESVEPALSRALTVMTYTSTNQVPSV